MDRARIIVQVTSRIDFFRGEWAGFCTRMEDYAGKLKECSLDNCAGTDRPGYRRIQPPWELVYGTAYMFVNMPLGNSFWMATDLVNPAGWFDLRESSVSRELSALRGSAAPSNLEDEILYDAVLLAVAHDMSVQGGAGRVYRRGTYTGKHFACDDFAEVLAERLRTDDSEVEMAWMRVKTSLPQAGTVGLNHTPPAKNLSETILGKPSVEQPEETQVRKPLGKRAGQIYEKLRSLKEHEAMTLPEIQNWYAGKNQKELDEGTWKRIRKELELYGLQNRPNVGYYIRANESPETGKGRVEE